MPARLCSGRDAVLAKPSLPLVTASDCRCDGSLRPSSLGVPSCGLGAAMPLTLIESGLFGRRSAPSLASCGAGRDFLELLGLPVTVALLANFGMGTGASDIISSTGRGLRAWLIANGPAWCGNNGTPTPASTRLASTVVGRTFSCMRSLLGGSPPPNTMRCTLLCMRRPVWKALDVGREARSWR